MSEEISDSIRVKSATESEAGSLMAKKFQDKLEKRIYEKTVLKKILAHPIFYLATVVALLSMWQVSGVTVWLTNEVLESMTYVFYGGVLFFFGLAYTVSLNATWQNIVWHMAQLGGGLGFIHMAFSAIRDYQDWKVLGLFLSILIFAVLGVIFGFFWSLFLLARQPKN